MTNPSDWFPILADQSGPSPKSPMKTSSRLSKTLQEILHDKDALHCFIQFMESQHAERFIRFWLDANSFRASTLTRMHTNSLQLVGSSTLLKRRTEMKSGADADRGVGQKQSEENLDENMSIVCRDGENVTDSTQKTELGGGGSDCDNQNRTSATGGASSSEARLSHSQQVSEKSQSRRKTEKRAERENKPSSLSLSAVPVQLQATNAFSDAVASTVSAEQSSPSSIEPPQSSLHDSGIAIASDGEFVITPSSLPESPGDSESVNTLLDNDSSATGDGGRKSDMAVNETNSAGVTMMAQDDANQAGTVISPSDAKRGEVKDDVDAQEGEGRETVGKPSRSMSVEEIKEKLKKSKIISSVSNSGLLLLPVAVYYCCLICRYQNDT